jgi:hypothetical protein
MATKGEAIEGDEGADRDECRDGARDEDQRDPGPRQVGASLGARGDGCAVAHLGSFRNARERGRWVAAHRFIGSRGTKL